jgi:kumamolisin
MSLDPILVEFPASLNSDQIQPFPSYTSIGQPPLLTAPKIATAYNIPSGNGAGVKVGIISLDGGFSQTDLNKSMANLGLTTGNVTFVSVDGTTNSYTGNVNSGDGENALDLVCVAGMVPAANIVLYKGQNAGIYFSSNISVANALNSNSSFGNAIQAAVNDNCDVISISWGIFESQTVSNVTSYCGDYLAGPLANAAAKGISVFVASGDYGSSATSNSGIGMNVDYPSASNNVTAVGGTYLTLSNANARISETVYNRSEFFLANVGGSGGVSLVTSLPSWQANLTYKTYPGNVVTTLSSRGVPDISAAMNAYGVWIGNTVYGLSGTSASAPIMAGMVARFISLNGGRRPPNGSAGLNSILYNHTSNFYDITTGNNASLLANGYSSTTGWDATTGLGPQLNATATYQAVTSAGLSIKNSGNTWGQVGNVYIKTGASTWADVQYIWTKTANGWAQTY